MSEGLQFRMKTEDDYALDVMTTQNGYTFIEVSKHRKTQAEFEAMHHLFDKVQWIESSPVADGKGFVTGKLKLGADITITIFAMEGCTKDEVQHLIKEVSYA